mgnify:FL=1
MRMKPLNVDNVNIMDVKNSDRAYHHGDLRNALIDAGLTALETQDAADLSLRALARSVGVSANAAYRHFADKDALLSALAAEGFRRFARDQAATGTHALNADQALASGLRYVQFAQRHPGLFRLMFGQFLHARNDSALQEAAMQSFAQLLAQSRPPRPDGRAPSGPPDEATLLRALAKWSLVHGLSHLLLEGQLDILGQPTPERLTAILEASGLGNARA